MVFIATEDSTASGLSNKILEILEPLQLDPQLCVGFGFDGASVMAGSKGGVQALLKDTFPNEVYIHCHSHSLNLVLCTASEVKCPQPLLHFDVLNSIIS